MDSRSSFVFLQLMATPFYEERKLKERKKSKLTCTTISKALILSEECVNSAIILVTCSERRKKMLTQKLHPLLLT